MLELGFIMLLGAVLALTPLVFHEMGHWVALRRFQVPVTEYWMGLGPLLFRWGKLRVGMLPIGGAVVPNPPLYSKLSARQKLIVALAGPSASLLYAAVSLLVWYQARSMPGADSLWLIGMLNLLLAGLNMVPVPPLDGFQAWVQWREIQGRPFSASTLGRAYRIGNGLVYGIGFFVLGLALWT